MELGEKYAYTVYKKSSFSKAAASHYVTQAALSTTVKKLENSLGFNIFDRSKFPITLTKQGEIYIEYLEEKAEAEKNLHQRINYLSESITEKLAVGGTSLLAFDMMPKVCGEFHKNFPNVEVIIDMGELNAYNKLFDKLDSGILQLVIGYSYDKAKYSAIPLMKERYVIAVRRDFVTSPELLKHKLTRSEILSGKDFSDKLILDFELFSDIKFHRVPKSGVIWRDMSDFLSQCSFSHCYIYNNRKNDITYNMMLNGLGAVVTTDYVISKFPERDDVLYFLVNTQKTSRQAMIIYKKDKELSPTEKEFVLTAQRLAKSK